MIEKRASYWGVSDKTGNILRADDTNSETDVVIAEWTPPGWVFNVFPIPVPDTEVITLDYIIAAMRAEIESCTEWDSVPLGRVLHVAHMLVSHQAADGLWPAVLNLRTAEDIGTERSHAPLPLFRDLNKILDSSEFDFAVRRIEAGISAQEAK